MAPTSHYCFDHTDFSGIVVPTALDALLCLPLAGAAWGLATFVIGLDGAVLQLAGRQVPATQQGKGG